ncbi:MAG: hypothetical protein WC242_03855 [Candidatus Paceibacterota bacterium]|jgi:hypothetical protein
MNKFSKKNILVAIIIIIFIALAWIGIARYLGIKTQPVIQTQTYNNQEYGFEMTFSDSWKGYTVLNNTWTGQDISGTSETAKQYSGPEIVFRNPNWTGAKHWQDIPIMVFTPDVWKLVTEEKIAVSAAPIGPSEVGRNQKFIFATPPRWYGFTDDLGMDEAVGIVKTFKAL